MAEITATRAVRGVNLFERRVGEGPASVVLHGGPGADHGYLLPGFDLLARDRTLIYYDQRGGGRSPVDRDVPVGWQEHVADLEALRQLWGFDRLSLIGYSWGALLAVLYAINHPDRVGSLALVSPAPIWRSAREEFERRFAARTASPTIADARRRVQDGGLRELDVEQYRKRMFEFSVAGYFHDPARAIDLTPFRITGRTQEAVWESLGDFDFRDEVAKLRIPALVVHGDDDPIPIETAEALARLLDAPLVPIPDCGHVPYVEAPDRFAAALDPFLPRAGRS